MHKKLFTCKVKLLKAAPAIVGLGLLLALPQDGNAQYGLYGFGQQNNGKLGNGLTTSAKLNPSATPIDNGANGKFIDIAAGQNHTLGIKEDGSLWAWGSNGQKQLGIPGITTDQSTPQQVDDGKGSNGKWKRVFIADLYSSFGIREDGSLWAWGQNTNKQLGLPGTPANNIDAPAQVMPGSKWLMVDGHSDDGGFTVGIQQDSTLWVWGSNISYQLGTGNTTNQNTPYNITPGEKWLMVSTGAYFTLAIKADGSLWGWGKGSTGIANTLGNGSPADVTKPAQIDPGTGPNGKWKKVAAGSYHTLAIRADGSYWAWGQNGGGRLGDGTSSSADNIKLIDDGKNGKWQDVVAANNYSYGMKENGSTYLWGDVEGTPSPYQSNVPKLVTEAGTLKNGRIFSGRFHSFWINEFPISCSRTGNHVTVNITTGGATVTWSAVTGSAGYEIAVDQTAALAPAGTAAPITDTFHNASGLLSGNTYYAHVRTSCGSGAYSEWDTISFTTLPCLPPLNIIAGNMGTGGGIVSWDSVHGAAGYEIAVDQTATPAPSGTPVPLTDTFYNATLTPGNTWYAHVRTDCGGGNYSDWDTVSFSTPPVCPQARNFKADNITSSAAQISWDAVSIATEYDIAVDTFSTLAPGGTASTQATTTFNASQLADDQRYIAHLRSHCGNGNYSAWDTLSFRTAKSGSVNGPGHENEVAVYPNPANQVLYIVSHTALNASVYNVQGQEVYTARQVHRIDIGHLNAGIYILKLTDTDGLQVKMTRFVKESR